MINEKNLKWDFLNCYSENCETWDMYEQETTWREYTCICAWLHINQHRFSLHICPYFMHAQGNAVETLLKIEVISYTKST